LQIENKTQWIHARKICFGISKSPTSSRVLLENTRRGSDFLLTKKEILSAVFDLFLIYFLLAYKKLHLE
jgi:hypothetical protein